MDRKKRPLISSTPQVGRKHNLMHLFTDIKCSPITMSSPFMIPQDPQPIPISSSSKPSGALKTGAVRKRRPQSKEKTAAQKYKLLKSTTEGVLEELWWDGEDRGNNLLSHSTNLYNKFPEPILIDSDEENSVVVKKPSKKCREDSKVAQSSLSQNPEEKRTKDRIPGSSRISRSARADANGKPKKQPSINPKNNVLGGTKDLKHSPKNDQATESKPNNHASSTSILVLDDDNSFPVYVPGTSIHRTNTSKRVKERVRISLGLNEDFQIDWGPRREKVDENKADKKIEEDKKVENKELETNNNIEGISEPTKVTKYRVVRTAKNTNVLDLKSRVDDYENKDDCLVSVVNEDKRVKKSGKQEETGKSTGTRVRGGGDGDGVPATACEGAGRATDGDIRAATGGGDQETGEQKVILSRFEEIIFKPRQKGGIVAQCLKTDDNDIGYVEIQASEVFSGRRENATFVVLEGQAKVKYSGKQQILSEGDMIYMQDSCRYEFTAIGSNHVRLLYIMVL